MKTKLSPRFWIALTLFGLLGQIAWVVENMYLNVYIYKMFNASAADISAMVAASAVAATLTTVLIGALSDKLGVRRPFLCGGYILWGLSILAFTLVRTDVLEATFPALLASSSLTSSMLAVDLVILLDCVMTFFGSSANDAAFNAWLTDSTDATNRGAAEGVNAMMPLIAILAVFGGFMAFDLNAPKSWTYIFAIIGGVVMLAGVLGLFLLREPRVTRCDEPYLRTVLHGFSPRTVRANAPLYFSLGTFILFNIAIQIFMPYLILYYEVSLGMSDYVLIMAPAILLASLATVFWGRVYDKKGFSFSVALSLLALCAGLLLLFLVRDRPFVFVGSLLMMCGYLCGMAVFGARIRDLTPVGEAGRFQGIRIFSQVLIPGIVGPFIGKTVLRNAQMITNSDGTESFLPNANIFLASLIVALLTGLVLLLLRGRQKPRLNECLHTPFEQDDTTSWSDHPRPQMRRDAYLSLCGKWHLSVLRGERVTPIGDITVPFVPESRLSGISRTLRRGERYLYETDFSLPEDFLAERVLLHLDAVDQHAVLTVNDKAIGSHEGGYLPFCFDITSALREGKNHLAVEVRDDLDTELCYGKQRKKRGGMWYTPVSGIWQPVWLEGTSREPFTSLRITPSLSGITVEVQGGREEKTLTVTTPHGALTHRFTGAHTTLEIPDPVLWTPDAPHLYDLTLTDGADTVHSYFGLRTVGTKRVGDNTYLTLNDQPLFCHGLLDQGYFSDGIYLPATPRGFLTDVLTAKSLGFNMLRKHIKIEPELFYYYCDKHGMLVFQDMVNSGTYRFLIDTALPTLGLRRGISHRATPRRRAHFEQTARDTIAALYNHPCVVYYTIFNEGWGQYDADRLYRELKAKDPTRVFDATSGWFCEKESDVKSEHIYFKKIRLTNDPDRPLVLSEFGGYSYKIAEHAFNLDKTYGYRFFSSRRAFCNAIDALYRDEILPAIRTRGLCATVLTQISDVEDETNGLLTYDRQLLKVDRVQMAALSSALHRAFREKTEQD